MNSARLIRRDVRSFREEGWGRGWHRPDADLFQDFQSNGMEIQSYHHSCSEEMQGEKDDESNEVDEGDKSDNDDDSVCKWNRTIQMKTVTSKTCKGLIRMKVPSITMMSSKVGFST
jgi:hypothetical protein